MVANAAYWNALQNLVDGCAIVIDRPKGTPHPRYPDFIYPYDYGYLEGTQSMDQGGIDIWVGSLTEDKAAPHRVVGIISVVDLVKKDAEIKILISCTKEECEEILKTHNSGLQAGILILKAEGM